MLMILYGVIHINTSVYFHKVMQSLCVQDWCSSHEGPPHIYLGAYRLEQDLSWTPEASFATRSKQLSLMDKLFSNEDIRLTRPSEMEHGFDIGME
jgi:hypothetical protein